MFYFEHQTKCFDTLSQLTQKENPDATKISSELTMSTSLDVYIGTLKERFKTL